MNESNGGEDDEQEDIDDDDQDDEDECEDDMDQLEDQLNHKNYLPTTLIATANNQQNTANNNMTYTGWSNDHLVSTKAPSASLG